MAKMREGKSLFQYETSTDASGLAKSSVSLVAIRSTCASWQISHHFWSKFFSCRAISTAISLLGVCGIFH